MPAAPRLDAVFHALGDPTRRAILAQLVSGERSTGVIARDFPLSRPAISKHLGVLHRAGIVTRRQVGRRQLYRVDPERLGDAQRWLEQTRAMWQVNLARLKRHLEEDHER